jgi:hypothetical protein
MRLPLWLSGPLISYVTARLGWKGALLGVALSSRQSPAVKLAIAVLLFSAAKFFKGDRRDVAPVPVRTPPRRRS